MSRVDLRLPEAGAEIAAQAAINPSLLGRPWLGFPRLGRSIQPLQFY